MKILYPLQKNMIWCLFSYEVLGMTCYLYHTISECNSVTAMPRSSELINKWWLVCFWGLKTIFNEKKTFLVRRQMSFAIFFILPSLLQPMMKNSYPLLRDMIWCPFACELLGISITYLPLQAGGTPSQGRLYIALPEAHPRKGSCTRHPSATSPPPPPVDPPQPTCL
jgi:hypothetical protein